jgi:hypothetical protein
MAVRIVADENNYKAPLINGYLSAPRYFAGFFLLLLGLATRSLVPSPLTSPVDTVTPDVVVLL